MEYKTLLNRLELIRSVGGKLPSVNRLLEYNLEDGDLIAAILEVAPENFDMDFNKTPWMNIYEISDRLLQTLLKVVTNAPKAYVYIKSNTSIQFTNPVWYIDGKNNNTLGKPYVPSASTDVDIVELKDFQLSEVKETFKSFNHETRQALKNFYFYSALLEAAPKDVTSFCKLCGRMRRADGRLDENQQLRLAKLIITNPQCIKKKHTYKTAMGALHHIQLKPN